MSHSVCPWWLGYALVTPLRRLYQDPRLILGEWVRPGMTVLEPGPGMGFFTLDLARLVGPAGRVIAVDIQPKMLEALVRRAKRAGLAERVAVRLARGESLGVDDLVGAVDFVLAFAVVHELPSAEAFLAQVRRVLTPGGRVLIAEPTHHVPPAAMEATIALAEQTGLSVAARPRIRGSRSVLLVSGSPA